MIKKTEYGYLVPFEDWDEIQEKINASDSEKEIQKLRKENEGLRTTLNGINSFLAEGGE